MGTNYYIKDSNLHIGKSSAGWKFLFRSYENLTSYIEWMRFLLGKSIVNEYGEKIKLSDFMLLINDKQGDKWDLDDFHYLDDNSFWFSKSEFC